MGCFTETDILLPKEAKNPEFMTKWSVIACDQYTSDISYWNKIKEFTRDNISSLNLIFPEIYLETESEEEINSRIKNIAETMIRYEENFVRYENAMFYIERTLKNGEVRRGIAGAVDLEEYSYKKDSKAKIKSTEETVSSRLPPRIKIRENSVFELPHAMILYEDEKNTLIEGILKNRGDFKKVYDFGLMQGGGKIAGYKLDEKNIDFVKNITRDFAFAVGDGNHSLAAAKEHWENIKRNREIKNPDTHPARYALAEIVNIYDESLEFEPIYRILFGVNPADVIKKFTEISGCGSDLNPHKFGIYYGGEYYPAEIKSGYNLPVKTLQEFLDGYIEKYGGRIDYIHGKTEAKELAKQKNSVSFIFETVKKSELFAAVNKDGVLPRKAFSMGEADDKRFYTECRKIKN